MNNQYSLLNSTPFYAANRDVNPWTWRAARKDSTMGPDMRSMLTEA